MAPGQVVTCAHVVHGAQGLQVEWQHHSAAAAVVGAEPPLESVADPAGYPLPDLAVLDAGADALEWGHPCVGLADGQPVLGRPADVLYLAGYTVEHSASPALTGATTEFESLISEGEHTFYKLMRGWAAVLVVCVSLGVFLTAAEPTGGHPVPETAEWLSALLVFGGTIAVLAAAGRRGSAVRRAAVYAIAAALAWALLAGFLKTATEMLATFGIGGMLTRWPVYALAAAAVAGTLLEQAALHVGPLSVSQPVLVVIDPFASIILSVWLFDERFTNSPAKVAAGVVSFAVMAVGVIALSRTAPQDLTPSTPARS